MIRSQGGLYLNQQRKWGLGNINQFMETSIPRRKELKKKEKEKENMTPFHSRKIPNEEWSRA